MAKTNKSPANIQASNLSCLDDLVGIALSICGGAKSLSLDNDESVVAEKCSIPAENDIELFKAKVASGDDILGREYCRIKSAEDRRSHGATFTPNPVIDSMFAWACKNVQPAFVIDAGAGSARYAISAAKHFPKAKIKAIEIDPVLRILAKSRIKILGLEDRIAVEAMSFLDFKRPDTDGNVLYIGNPPYLRHHGISASDKKKYAERCKNLGVSSSGLAGLHIHFMVKVFEIAKKGDVMAFITAAEWMDANYGKSLRDLLSSGQNKVCVDSFEKEDLVFDDALTSAAITCVQFGLSEKAINFGKVTLQDDFVLGTGKDIPVALARSELSWNGRMLDTSKVGSKQRTLGDLFRVSRGLVTGMNEVWISSKDAPNLPEKFLLPCITKAEDLTSLNDKRLNSTKHLRRLIRLPETLSGLTKAEASSIKRFLAWAKEKGADKTFTAKHRKCWWTVNIKDPPPIVMTYMGRRPPVFVRNDAGVPLLNIAHGLYPKTDMTDEELDALVDWLNKNVSIDSGRTYAGGLVKFEPGEAMRIAIPDIEEPSEGAA